MKITQSKAKDLVAKLTVEVFSSDYTKQVDNILKDYRKKVVVPGFRKGKTPMSIIEKKYKESVIVEEVNKLIQDDLYKYITENKVKVLGSPLPLDENQINWKEAKDFEFFYEIGLSPEFDLKITKKDKLDYHKINVDSKLVKQYCDDIAKRNGEMNNVDTSEEGDLVFCSIAQLDVKGEIVLDGISNEATVSMDHISDKNIKRKFIGLKMNDILNINVMKAFTNHTDLAAMLGISTEEIKTLYSAEFQFTIKKINRLKPAELNKELFGKVFPTEKITEIKKFKDRIKKEIENQFVHETDKMLKNDVVTYLIEKLKLKLPDEFLKRWLLRTSKQPINKDLLEKEYDMYSKSLQWQLIENKILETYNIKVDNNTVVDYTKDMLAIQMKQYGQQEKDDKKLTEIANNILENKEEKKKIYDRILDERTLKVYKENFKLIEKSVSYDDFIKLASGK